MAPPAYSPLITVLVITTLLHFTMARPPPPPAPAPAPLLPPESECVGELVLFSPCLSFVSAPPNNLSETVPPRCCDAFLSSINTGDASCLCYLLRLPQILGFPLNESRVLSLPSACSFGTDESANSGYLEALCSGSEPVPPLQNVTVPGVSDSSDSGSNNQSIPLGSLPPESNNPSAPPSLSPESNNASAPSNLPFDSKNSSSKPSPPPDLAKGPPKPPSSSSESELPSSAMAHQFYSTNSLFQMGLLVFLRLISTCL